MFDREGDDGKFVSVTVKATDQGEPSLEGVCSFTVEITDVNDNPPLFDRQVMFYLYVHSLSCLCSKLCYVCIAYPFTVIEEHTSVGRVMASIYLIVFLHFFFLSSSLFSVALSEATEKLLLCKCLRQWLICYTVSLKDGSALI